ncbi:Helicase SWR1 [Galdieria sulphuraria]|nr:Helicase SWR1 [Galdieria sulphuraria]
MDEVSSLREEKLRRKRKSYSVSEQEIANVEFESTGSRSTNSSPTLRIRNVKHPDCKVSTTEKDRADGQKLLERQVQNIELERARHRVLEKLKDIRRRAVASRDEHKRQLLVIERQVSASTAALLRAKTMREAKKKLPDFDQLQRSEVDLLSFGNYQIASKQFPVSFSSAPALPASYVYGQSDPPHRLSYEENILKAACEIVKKNTTLAMTRLPKQPEPPRAKVLWDYLLDEVVWLAVDFREERKHKICLAKRIADDLACRNVSTLCNETERRFRANSLASLVVKFWKSSRNLYLGASMKRNRNTDSVAEQQLYESLLVLDDSRNEIPNSNEENFDLEGDKKTSEMTSAEAGTTLCECLVSTEEQRDEEITALFDSVNNMSSYVDPEEYLMNTGNVNKPEGQDTYSGVKFDERIDEKENSFTLNNNVAGFQRNCFVDFGFFEKSVFSFLDKLTNMFGDENFSSSSCIERIPYFNGTLKEFQFKAVQWLASCYLRKWNVLLADDRNCGKTVSVIAFLTWLANERVNMDPFLMIASRAEMERLDKECKRWLSKIEIVVLDKQESSLTQRDSFSASSGKFLMFLCPYEYLKDIADALFRRRWHCLILKDAHNLRNLRNEEFKLLENFQSEFRMLLTGHYDICLFSDLWRFLRLLVPKILPQELRNIDVSFTERLSGSRLKPIMNKLERAMKPFTLRRKKEQLLANFPKRIEEIVTCSLSKKQRRIYNEVISKKRLSDYPNQYSFSDLLFMVNALKRICNSAEFIEPTFSSSPFSLPNIQFHIPKDIFEICDMKMFSYESSFFLIRKSLSLLHSELYSNGNKENNCENSIQPSTSSYLLSGEEEWQQSFRFLVNNESSSQRESLTEEDPEFSLSRKISYLQTLDVPTELLLKPAYRYMKSLVSSAFFNIIECTNRNMFETVSFYPELLHAVETRKFSRTLSIMDFGVTRAVAKTPVINHPRTDYENRLESLKLYMQNTAQHDSCSRYRMSFHMESNSGKLTCLRLLLENLMKLARRCVVVCNTLSVLDVLEYFMLLNKFTYARLDSTISRKQRYAVAANFSQNSELLCCIMTVDSNVSWQKFSGVDTLIYFEHCLDLEKDSQVEHTVYNLSQERPIHVLHLVSSETVEERMMKKDIYQNLFKGFSSVTSIKNPKLLQLISELISDPGYDNIESRVTSNRCLTESAKNFEENSFAATSGQRDRLEEYFSSIIESGEIERVNSIFSVDAVDDVLEDSDIVFEYENNRSISGIQCYSLNILDRIRTEIFAPEKLSTLINLFNSRKFLVVDPLREDSPTELFYTRMMDEDSRSSYSRAIENSGTCLKIYLPLHDGGKEEMTMSTVVDKTAAIGIESAEDAAFFPYAYSRLSRTSDATRLQKANTLEPKFLEQNGQSSYINKGADSWEGGSMNRTGTMSPVTNKQLRSHERNRARAPRRTFFDGSEDKFLLWTSDEDRELLRTVKSCYENYLICRYWLKWTTFSLCRLKRPRTEYECKARFESFSNDSRESSDSFQNASTDSHLLKRHLSLLVSAVQKNWKQNHGGRVSSAEVCTLVEPHPSYAKLEKSMIEEGVATTILPEVIPSPKITNEEWKPGFKTTDVRSQQPFIRRSSMFSRVNYSGSGSILSAQGTFRSFRQSQKPQKSEMYGKSLKRPLNNMGSWSGEQRSQLLNAKSLTLPKAGTTMSSSGFSMRPTILTKLMRKQSEQSRNWKTDVKLSFENGANFQSDTNPMHSRISSSSNYTRGDRVQVSTRDEVLSSDSSLSRDKTQANEWQTSTNSLKRSRKSLRLDESR